MNKLYMKIKKDIHRNAGNKIYLNFISYHELCGIL